jgi:hypothetical protein
MSPFVRRRDIIRHINIIIYNEWWLLLTTNWAIFQLYQVTFNEIYLLYTGFELWSGQTKDYNIGICCFSAKHVALRSKSKDWLARNQNNVSEWTDMSTSGLLFQVNKRAIYRLGIISLAHVPVHTFKPGNKIIK